MKSVQVILAVCSICPVLLLPVWGGRGEQREKGTSERKNQSIFRKHFGGRRAGDGVPTGSDIILWQHARQ
jgi:hypothetical protein